MAKEKKYLGGAFEARTEREEKLQERERGRRLIWSRVYKGSQARGTKIGTFGCRSAIPAETKVIRPLYEVAWTRYSRGP